MTEQAALVYVHRAWIKTPREKNGLGELCPANWKPGTPTLKV